MRLGIRNISLMALLFVTAIFGVNVFAATTVTNVYDQPTSLKISDASNHHIVITASEAVEEGETLTIIFPSSYDTSSIIEDDVDVADDSTDLTTAVNCTGLEQASVAMVADVLTITICAGDGGAIATASVVTVEIGTNAAASGSGTNQITNPSIAATYFAGIGGTSGMTGSIPIPVVSDDDSAVSAIVAGSSDGGGGGGSPPSGGAGTTTDTGTDDTTTDDTSTDDTTPDDTTVDDTATDDAATDDTTTDDITTDDGATTNDGPTSDEASDSGTPSDSGQAIDSGSGSSLGDPESNSTDSGVGKSRDVDVTIIVADKEINLGGGDVDVLPNTEALVRVEIENSEDVESAEVVIDDQSYVLVEVQNDIYETVVIIPSSDSTITVVVDYNDGSTSTDVVGLDTKPPGWVYEVINGERVAVGGAIVIVYESGNLDQWNAGNYGQSNPLTVGAGGGFAWYAPNGSYKVTAGKSGYEDSEATVTVRNNILTANIELKRIEEIAVIEDQVDAPDVGVQASVTQAVKNAVEAIQNAVDTINTVRELPEIQTAADIAKPVTIAAASGSAVVLFSSFNLLSFLRYLFTSPILFFARRKRRQFGIIYNAITKVPVDLAIVRLYTESGKLIKTMVTDKEGRYFFKTEPGRYKIQVTRRGFEFPSDYIKDLKSDGKYLDVYSGGLIEVTDRNVVISANIPMDPSQSEKFHTPKKLIIARFLRVLQHVLALSGLALAIGVVIIQPSLLTIGLLAVHVSVYTITRILTRAKNKKGWGIVAASADGKPVANTVVRLFEPKYNKLIESTLTDGQGRYAFLAGANQYFVTFDKDGYERHEVRPIDYSQNIEPKVISLDVKLSKTVV